MVQRSDLLFACFYVAVCLLVSFALCAFARSVLLRIVAEAHAAPARAQGGSGAALLASAEEQASSLRASYTRAKASLADGGRSPFAQNGAAAPAGGEGRLLMQVPPTMKIKGIFYSAAGKNVTLELNGSEAYGPLQQGASFSEGRGEILRIGEDGVVWRWLGTTYETHL
jgi:hypothetical protein